ncbi:MAG: hypothetical protein MHM6MM_005113 [Cercozoa sp. M6MM]
MVNFIVSWVFTCSTSWQETTLLLNFGGNWRQEVDALSSQLCETNYSDSDGYESDGAMTDDTIEIDSVSMESNDSNESASHLQTLSATASSLEYESESPRDTEAEFNESIERLLFCRRQQLTHQADALQEIYDAVYAP